MLKLEKLNCESVLINTHYLHEKVEEYISSWHSPTLKVTSTYEEKLLGTAGTLIKNQEFFSGSIGLLIHADNITDSDLSNFLKAHENKPSECLMSMLTFNTLNPSQCGIVQSDQNGILRGFFEKVSNPPGNRANGALYALDNDFFDYLKTIPENCFDFSTEVIPNLIGKIYTWHTNDMYLDIGTYESLNKALEHWKNINVEN